MNTIRRRFIQLICIALIVSSGSAQLVFGFSFPVVDYVDINTGFKKSSAVPTNVSAPRWDALDFVLGTGGIWSGRSLQGNLTYNY